MWAWRPCGLPARNLGCSGRLIAFQDRHPLEVLAEHRRRRHAGDAAADDQRVLAGLGVGVEVDRALIRAAVRELRREAARKTAREARRKAARRVGRIDTRGIAGRICCRARLAARAGTGCATFWISGWTAGFVAHGPVACAYSDKVFLRSLRMRPSRADCLAQLCPSAPSTSRLRTRPQHIRSAKKPDSGDGSPDGGLGVAPVGVPVQRRITGHHGIACTGVL